MDCELVMFWRKRKSQEIKTSPSLLQLATKLGVERRLNVRMRYPDSAQLSRLPEVYYHDSKLRVIDISVGGCCILDPKLLLGAEVGHDIELNIHWPTGVEKVKARIVSRVDHRRHIQFMDLSRSRQNYLNKAMATGIRGQNLRRHGFQHKGRVIVEAAELWSSPLGDSIILESGVHRLAQLQVQNEQYFIFKDAWPQKVPGGKCAKAEFEQLILFLCNVATPSPMLKDMLVMLEKLWSQS